MATQTEDLLGRVRQEVETRLGEVKSVLTDHEQLLTEKASLENALAALGGTTNNGNAPQATGESPAATPAPRRRRSRRRRASGEKRRTQLLGLIRENPDIKARGIADAIGTTPNNVYNLLRRLEAEGAIKRAEGKITLKASA